MGEKLMRTYMPYAINPVVAPAERLPIKNHENRLLVSSRLYHLVIVNKQAGMNPASANLG